MDFEIDGRLDLGIAWPTVSGADLAPHRGVPSNHADTVRPSATSRLGFSGTQDRGGDPSARAQVDHRRHPDTGAALGGSGFRTAASVGLTAPPDSSLPILIGPNTPGWTP